ncbi:MAG: flagellar biosynthesis protein FlhF [Methylococcaceae bacterium]|jgi:flagellar biosynthesis protein FlhF
MKTQRFFALTARETLTQVREALGPDAIILSNRSVNNGVEILASHERDFALAIEESHSVVAQQPEVSIEQTILDAPKSNDITLIMDEIRSMRGSLENQLSALSWTSQQQQHPAKSGILRELLAMGFSASLARYLAENVPAEIDIEQGLKWSKETLMRNLSIITNEDHFLDQGGVFALVGPTGVGKTTTTAKLAARCVMRHGASKLGLITTDSYRIGAHEQLRIYGKILGVMIHSVRDETDLHIALDELKNKHTVIIDTVGMSQRDQMVAEQIAMLSGARNPIKRILCMNATSTIETLNEVVTCYRGSGLAGCILTKLDEAVTLSNALDVILRQKLKLFYVGTGQRVPEDLHLTDAEKLVDSAFQHRHAKSATRYEDSELPLLMTTDTTPYNPSNQSTHVK